MKIFFTDLDGTLLDYNYSFKNALQALKRLKQKKIPLIICTSKTRVEIEYYRKLLENKEAFVSENGAAVFVPKELFEFKIPFSKETEKYFVFEFGTVVGKIKECVKEIQENGIEIKAFTEMPVDELMKETGLTEKLAGMAKKREYSETIELVNEEKLNELKEIIKRHKLNLIKGTRFYSITGRNDKGKAVKLLKKWYEKKLGKLKAVAFGDSENDFEMLLAVQKGFLVQKKNGEYASQKFEKAAGIASKGFNSKVLELLKND